MCATRAVDSALEVTGFSRPRLQDGLEILASLRLVVEAIHGSPSIVRRKHRRPAIRIKPGGRAVQVKLSEHCNRTI